MFGKHHHKICLLAKMEEQGLDLPSLQKQLKN